VSKFFFFVVLNLLSIISVFPCSSFSHIYDDGIIVGRNMDEGFEVPGAIYLNPRGVRKTSFSMSQDISSLFGFQGSAPREEWVSQYGSITYNMWGRDLPDGGMNELGLVIGEMSLYGSRSTSGAHVNIFPPLWMQYVLDNFATVAQVLQSLENARPAVEIPHSWHYYIVDSTGEVAIVSMFDGELQVFTGDEITYSLLCNTLYQEEASRIRIIENISGNESAIGFGVDMRFLRGLNTLLAQENVSRDNIQQFGFDVLNSLSGQGTQWSLLFDTGRQVMEYRTHTNPEIRIVNLEDLDFDSLDNYYWFDLNNEETGPVNHLFQIHGPDDLEYQLRRTLDAISELQTGLSRVYVDFRKPTILRRLVRHLGSFSFEP